MIPSFESRHSLGGRACPQLFGGDSSSSSSSDQTTTNNYSDSRSVLGIDDHSVNTALTNSGNTSTSNSTSTSLADAFNTDNTKNTSLANSLNTTNTSTSYTTTTDMGAVSAGSSVSMAALGMGENLGIASFKQNSLNFDSLLGVADTLFSATKKTTDANLQLAGSLSSNASQAYSDATAQATGNKSLIMVAIAVVGLVAAVFAFQK